jgi:hypothetical protein
MRNMNIDQIVELYRNGYELSDHTLNTLQNTCPTTSLIMAGLVGGFIVYAALKYFSPYPLTKKELEAALRLEKKK